MKHGRISERIIDEWVDDFINMKIIKENLNLTAYTILKQMIDSNRFKPGERINVEKIKVELGVSRTPIWEAIRRLEQEGVVKNLPHSGVFVSVLTLEEALDLIVVREALETLAAKLAAIKIDERSIQLLEKELHKQKKIVESLDMAAYAQSDANFHALIYESTGNIFLCDMLQKIHSRLRPIAIHMNTFINEFYNDHLKIVEALKAHNPEKVEAYFKNHTKDIMNVIRHGDLTFLRNVLSNGGKGV
jgi:DNA-binding GntR family transcriptional regulator